MTQCVLCKHDSLVYSHEYIYRSNIFQTLFPSLKIFECAECGLFQVDHTALNLGLLTDYYESHYRKDAGISVANTKWDEEILTERARQLVTSSLSHLTSRENVRVFEVGAGYGENLRAFGKALPNAALYSDEVDTYNLRSGIEKSSLDDGPFHVVIMSHVLEHLIYPRDYIDRVFESLHEGGLLIVEVPNEGREFVCQASFHQPFHEPHITFFSVETLQSFFSHRYESKFQTIQISSVGTPIEDVVERRTNKKPGLLLRWMLQFVRKFESLERLFRKAYCAVVYRVQQPTVNLADDIELTERLYLRIILKK